MSINGPEDRTLHDALDRMSREADGANIDLAAVSAGVSRGRRRREMRQRAGVGAMAAVLVGGMAFGGMAIFSGSDGGGGNIAGPTRDTASEFPEWEDVQCGAVFPILEHEGNEPRLIATTEQIAMTLIYPPPPVTSEDTGLGADLVSGEIDAGELSDFDVWMLNPEDGEQVTGGSNGYAAPVVVRDGYVIGMMDAMPEPYSPHDLQPGELQLFATTGMTPCDSFDGKFTGDEEIYYVVEASDANTGDVTKVWGGPWTLSAEGSSDDIDSTHVPLNSECTDYTLDGDETVDGCALQVYLPRDLIEGPVTVDEFDSAQVTLVHALSGVDRVEGAVRPRALAEIRDADGNIVNPEVGQPDQEFIDFLVTPNEHQPLNIYSGVDPTGEGAITLEPGTYTVTLHIDLEFADSDSDGTRMSTEPFVVDIYDPNEAVLSEPQEPGAEGLQNPITRDEIPADVTVSTPECTLFRGSERQDINEIDCPFAVHTNLSGTVDRFAIEDTTAWLTLDESVYSELALNYGSTSLQMEVLNADGDVVIEAEVMGDAMMRYLFLDEGNAWGIVASSQAWTYDWDGLPAGDYTASFTFDGGIEGVQHNPDYDGEPDLPVINNEASYVEEPGVPAALEATWTVDFSVD